MTRRINQHNPIQDKKTLKFLLGEKLVRIYKIIKNEPLKVWVKSDFKFFLMGVHGIESYLNILIRLGLIKKVNAVYYHGLNYKTLSGVKGYKYNNNQNNNQNL